MNTKQNRQTRKIELVETHNIVLSLLRIKNAPGYDSNGAPWKRALYHAMLMAYAGSRDEQTKLREALGLP